MLLGLGKTSKSKPVVILITLEGGTHLSNGLCHVKGLTRPNCGETLSMLPLTDVYLLALSAFCPACLIDFVIKVKFT